MSPDTDSQERNHEASRPTCRNCGDYPVNHEGLCEDCRICVECEDAEGYDDWELGGGVRLCSNCHSARTRGDHVPQEWVR